MEYFLLFWISLLIFLFILITRTEDDPDKVTREVLESFRDRFNINI